MPGRGMTPRHFQKPRINWVAQEVGFDEFTDGGSTAGTYLMRGTIPVNSYVLGTRIVPVVGFTGDTTATIIVGEAGGDTDRYSTGTPSVFTTALDGIDAGVPSGVRSGYAGAVRPTITIVSGSDWGLVVAGRVYVEIAYLEFSR